MAFSFLHKDNGSGEGGWETFTIAFVTASGKLCFLTPAIPLHCHLPLRLFQFLLSVYEEKDSAFIQIPANCAALTIIPAIPCKNDGIIQGEKISMLKRKCYKDRLDQWLLETGISRCGVAHFRGEASVRATRTPISAVGIFHPCGESKREAEASCIAVLAAITPCIIAVSHAGKPLVEVCPPRCFSLPKELSDSESCALVGTAQTNFFCAAFLLSIKLYVVLFTVICCSTFHHHRKKQAQKMALLGLRDCLIFLTRSHFPTDSSIICLVVPLFWETLFRSQFWFLTAQLTFRTRLLLC